MMKQPDQVAVLGKAFDLLEVLAEHPGQTVADLAGAAGVTKATAYRILSTLEMRGYVVTYEKVRRYSIGHAFHAYLQAARRDDRLLHAARPAMLALLGAFDETVNLGVPARQGILYLDVLESTQGLRATSEIGRFDTLHSTALGKAMLSRMPEAVRQSMLADARLVAFTEHTVTDRGELARRIERAASVGYAIDDQENEMGMRCVAAPIVNADGRPVAALSISAPASRMTDAAISRIGAELVVTTARIAAQLAQP